jgi:DDE domain
MNDCTVSSDAGFWTRARRHLLKYGGEFVDFVPVRAEGRAFGCGRRQSAASLTELRQVRIPFPPAERYANQIHPEGDVIFGPEEPLPHAVDYEGEVLDMLVQSRRDSRAGLRLMRKLLEKQGFAPKLLVTDSLRSYAAAFRRLG